VVEKRWGAGGGKGEGGRPRRRRGWRASDLGGGQKGVSTGLSPTEEKRIAPQRWRCAPAMGVEMGVG
jgi:hypothetical protein